MRFRIWAAMLLGLWLVFSMGMVAAAPAGSDVRITGVRWTRTADAATGLIKIRLALETSGPVEVEQFLTAMPNWRLILTLNGVKADNLTIPSSPDDSVVTKMSVVKSSQEITRVIVDFPGAWIKDQYKITTVPADSKTKTPFQVVIDVQKTVKPGELNFLPGLKGKTVVG